MTVTTIYQRVRRPATIYFPIHCSKPANGGRVKAIYFDLFGNVWHRLRVLLSRPIPIPMISADRRYPNRTNPIHFNRTASILKASIIVTNHI